MSWKWIIRGVKSRDEFKRLEPQKVSSEVVSKRKLRNARGMSADELRDLYGIKLCQIEAGSITSFRGADSILEIKPLLGFEDLESMPKIVDYMTGVKQFQQPTAIQRAAIPLGLAGKSFIGIAPTGSGKTYAFVIPIVNRFMKSTKRGLVRALILSPTRELASQTCRVFAELLEESGLSDVRVAETSALAKAVAAGDVSYADILVCTPGMRHLVTEQPSLLTACEVVVFDEVDALLNASFLKACDIILKRIVEKRHEAAEADLQLMMFSASLQHSGEILELISQVLPKSAPIIRIGSSTMSASRHVELKLVNTGTEAGKISAMQQLLEDHELIPPCLIFVQDKDRVEMLLKLMNEKLRTNSSFTVGGLHSNMSAAARATNYQQFQSGELWFLISTDIAARGLDFNHISLVLNFDIPTTRENLIHRIGRTGRGELRGRSITFYTAADIPFMRVVTSVMRETKLEIPDELKALPVLDSNDFMKHPPLRKPIGHLDREVAGKFLKKFSVLKQKENSNNKKTVKIQKFKGKQAAQRKRAKAASS